MAGKVESAAMVLSKISRTHLECSICHERYQTPKLLECLHSFCENCLVRYKESVMKNSAVMQCPVCRKETKITSDGIAGLRTNFHLMGMVEDFTLQEKLTQRKGLKLLCELCRDQQEAEARCMDCPFFLCVNCHDVHRRIAATANHEVLALDTLRCGVVSLRPKFKDDPPCEKHRGEKKRFYCETCKELICRDCTVVEHRESEHKFTTVDDAASRFRKITEELIVKVQEIWTAHKETQLELTQMASELQKCGSLAHQQVTDEATEEGSKIEERQANFKKDISRREKLRLKTFRKNGIHFTRPQNEESKPTEGVENSQKYSKSLDDKFTTIDKALVTLSQHIETFLKTDQDMHSVIEGLKEESLKDATNDQSKVTANRDKLLSEILDTHNLRQQVIKEVDKITNAQILRLHHALDIASDVVKSASNVDFLNLQSVIDNDLRALLEESPPKLHSGYPKIEFKSSGDTGVGQVVIGAAWMLKTDIHVTTSYNYYGTNQVMVKGICAFTNDKILVAETYGLCVCDTTNSSSNELNNLTEELGVASFPDNSFASMDSSRVLLFAPNLSSCKSEFQLPSTIKQKSADTAIGRPTSIAHYNDKLLIVGYIDWQGVLVLDSSDGSVIRQLPVSIKPDFLASTSRGRILVGARSPAIVEGLDGKGDTAITIHPTIEGTPEGKQVNCAGICRDTRDIIYLALSSEDDSKVHVHQYSPYGSFIGCCAPAVQPPVGGIAVTGDDKLVLAEKFNLKVFEMKDCPKTES